MGKMLILLTTGMIGLFGLTTFNMTQSNTRMSQNTVVEYGRLAAKNLAASGVEMSLMNLTKDTTWAGVNNYTLGEGELDVVIDTTTNRFPTAPYVPLGSLGRKVVSTGSVYNQSVTIQAVIRLGRSFVGPAFMKYALLSEDDLDLRGNVQIQDDNNNNWNADIHTNHDLRVNGNVDVAGFGSYVENMTLRPNNESRFFQPNVNPQSLPLTSQIPRIDIPDFNADDYIDIATDVHNGDLNLSGNQTLGSKENPKIWYVDGDLNLHGNYTGYGIFIVTGEITISGNVDFTVSDPLGNNMGLYAEGDITMSGNVSVDAQLFSEEDVNFNGNVDLHGLATAGGEIDFRGNVNVYYRPSSPNLTNPIWPGDPKRAEIVSYYH